MDLSDTIAPTSDQLDAVDLLTGPRTFTIERVSKGNAEQPVNIFLAEFPRPWRPGKSMRRVLVAVWGPDASTYAGRKVTLYCDPKVRFGGAEVGGTRISHMSHLDKPRTIPLLITRGKSAPYSVKPLTEDVPRPTSAPASRIDALRAEWSQADPDRRKVIEAEVAALSNTTTPTPEPAGEPAPVDEDSPYLPGDPDLTAHERGDQ